MVQKGVINKMNTPPDINSCKYKIIKYSKQCVIFFNNNSVYKQYPLNKYKWVNELAIVNYLNQTPNNYIIKFTNCEIINDYVIDTKTKEICLDKKEMMLRLTMEKYNATLNSISNFADNEVFFIINNLLAALLFCKSKNVLHRDIKECNIFINYTTASKINKPNHRTITELVLGDFNISKYNIKNKKRCCIMTPTHRSPEIWKSMSLRKPIEYDDRVDVWSFCVVVSYLITNRSFYVFLTERYLENDPNILHSSIKQKVAMGHFLNIYTRKRLRHINIFTKIIYMGMKPYDTRYTFDDIYNELMKYTSSVTDITIPNMKPYSRLIPSPEISCNMFFSRYLTFVNVLHNRIKNNDVVLYTFYNNISCMAIDLQIDPHYTLIAEYLLTSYIINDRHKNIGTYLKKIKQRSLVDSDKINNIFQNVSAEIIKSVVIKLLNTSHFNILY